MCVMHVCGDLEGILADGAQAFNWNYLEVLLR